MTIPTAQSHPVDVYLFTCSTCTSHDLDPILGCEVTEPVFQFDTARERDDAAAVHTAACGGIIHPLDRTWWL